MECIGKVKALNYLSYTLSAIKSNLGKYEFENFATNLTY